MGVNAWSLDGGAGTKQWFDFFLEIYTILVIFLHLVK